MISQTLIAGQVVYLQVNAFGTATGAYTVVAHKATTSTQNVTVNKDQSGNTLSSTTGYSQVSSSTSQSSSTSSNGDTVITNTTTVIWQQNGGSTSTALNLPVDTATAGTIANSGQTVYYKFTAATAGTYSFYTTGSMDTMGTLYNSSNSSLANNDDASSANRNFMIRQSLTAGQVVYLQVAAFSGTGSYTVFAHKATTTTSNVTVNQDTLGNTLTSTSGYTQVSSSSSQSTTTAVNGDITITNTTTVVWHKPVPASFITKVDQYLVQDIIASNAAARGGTANLVADTNSADQTKINAAVQYCSDNQGLTHQNIGNNGQILAQNYFSSETYTDAEASALATSINNQWLNEKSGYDIMLKNGITAGQIMAGNTVTVSGTTYGFSGPWVVGHYALIANGGGDGIVSNTTSISPYALSKSVVVGVVIDNNGLVWAGGNFY